ncbi:glycoside hydrolase family 13 protein [Massilia sp. H6]|uniref:glycoside hydrolase family 13 protein n=1 Tax=Massilia sp. H6 TaxID=2970464 RepID=UPI00216A1822|nr:glycoside hydrolase family 13 protein [Massilia sp. H6]UVW29598.1 glycoside hydrolase family 13 protein [Massilia sp. H6]
MILRTLIFLSSLIAFLPGLVPGARAATGIDRVEPPNWWVGMKSDKLQLMVHGEDIAGFTPQLASGRPGVRLAGVQRVASKNYVFLDLRIAPSTRPGAIEIVFRRGAEVRRLPYQLQARAPGSAQRPSFGNADAIMLLMPDRFANGDPGNDNVPGFPDPANRADIDAGRHGGDIAGIVDKLDYIAAMGYTAIWPTPLTESRQDQYSYHGYAATDTYRIDPRYGSNEDYRRMVALARSKGVGVLMDVVLNHIGSNHWWMKDLPTPDWLGYGNRFVPTAHARTTASDPYAAQADRKNYVQGWFGSDMPDLNQKNPLLANYLIQHTLWWVEYAGLYGIRVDTFGYSDHAFLAAWSRRVREEFPTLNIVGEEWSMNPLVVSYWLDGKRNPNGYRSAMPSMMDYPLNDTLRRALVAEDSLHSGLSHLYERLNDDVAYPDASKLVVFEGNHDIPRLYSILGEDLDLYKMAIAYLLTTRGVPQLYYGTELLMTSPLVRADGPTRQDFPGGWRGDRVDAVSGAGLDAKQKQAQAYVRKLLNWRKTQALVHSGKLMHFAPEDGTYVYFRYDGTGQGAKRLMVAINKNRKPVSLDTARFAEILPRGASGTDVVSGETYALGRTLAMPARSVLVLEVDR